MEAELTVAFLAFTESYVSTVTCVPYESVEVRFPRPVALPWLSGAQTEQAVAASGTPLFRSLSTTWRFAPAPADARAGHTLLTLDLAYAFASPLHAAAAGAFFGTVSRAMIEAFETRCTRVYGRR
jgi:coenzyme Q-binding protein COQ10